MQEADVQRDGLLHVWRQCRQHGIQCAPGPAAYIGIELGGKHGVAVHTLRVFRGPQGQQGFDPIGSEVVVRVSIHQWDAHQSNREHFHNALVRGMGVHQLFGRIHRDVSLARFHTSITPTRSPSVNGCENGLRSYM